MNIQTVFVTLREKEKRDTTKQTRATKATLQVKYSRRELQEPDFTVQSLLSEFHYTQIEEKTIHDSPNPLVLELQVP